jgi:hypothetical protein
MTSNSISLRPRKNVTSHRPAIRTLHCALLLCSAYGLCGPAVGLPAKKIISSRQDRTQANEQPQTKTNTNGTLDACSLLTDSEIASVLGEPLQERKPSVQATGNIRMSQCVFVTRDFAKSASLAVATPAATDTGGHSLRAFWRNQFHSPRKPEEEKRPASRKTPAKSAFASSPEGPESKASPHGESGSESNREPDNEADEAGRKPQPISGLGEEAYSVGGPISGALYVLQGELFLRISVGGVPKESIRIAKSKSLAATILRRLPHNPR